MKSLTDLTNKRLRLLLRIALCLAAGTALAGCGMQSGMEARLPARPLHGVADLGVLVRRQPGWAGVGQYDAALASLDAAARSLPPFRPPNQKIATLPPLPLSTMPVSLVLPSGQEAQIALHLDEVQQTLIADLQDRRQMARADQLRRQQELWRREARLKYLIPARTAELSTDLDLQLLQANVATLTRTLANWKQSPPPAPRLDRLKIKVEADRARLVALIAVRLQARTDARAARQTAVKRVREQRTAYVQTQADALAAKLLADDERLSAAQRARLTAQRLALLEALAQPEAVAVPPVGDMGAISLPNGPGAARASLSAASLVLARTKLTAQRERWIRYLYDDTRAAALDVAAQRHWIITFGAVQHGEKDLTPALVSALDTARGFGPQKS